VAGTALFGLASLTGGLAPNAGTLVGARLAQRLGAALMSPAALSLLTTSFSYGTDRVKALGAWGAVGGLSSVIGVFLGGVIAAGPGWRWVLFVNLPVCAVVLAAAFRLVDGGRPGPFGQKEFEFSSFDTLGAILGTAGMLLLIFGLVLGGVFVGVQTATPGASRRARSRQAPTWPRIRRPCGGCRGGTRR